MMQKASKTVILLLVIFFVFTQITAAGNKLAQWGCSAKITQKGTDHYKAFFLNELVYENSQADLSDIRIIDQNNRFVPYFIISGYGIEQESRMVYDSQLIKKYQKAGNSIFDFRIIPLLKTADIMGNQLKLVLPAENFLKKVRIFGGYDGNIWQNISDDQLYRVDNLIKDQIALGGAEKYTYYRIIVLNNSDNINLPKLQLINENTENDWVAFQKTARLKYKISNRFHDTNDTIITIYNPQHLKVKQISLSVTGNFRRRYQVFDNPEISKPIKTGDIYSLKFKDLAISETAISLADNPCSSRVIKIKIINNDNQPLQIKNIQTYYYIDQIVFEDLGSRDYRLYFGNPQAKQPVYDLESFKSHILKEPVNLLNLQDFQITKPKVAAAKSVINLNLFFNIVIVAVTLLLIIFIVRKLNNQKAA